MVLGLLFTSYTVQEKLQRVSSTVTPETYFLFTSIILNELAD